MTENPGNASATPPYSPQGDSARTTDRPIARLIICLAILLLGAAAALTLDLSYLPTWSLPELTVSLRLPETTKIDDLTERWVLPLESAIRAVGDVTSAAGEVNVSGARFQVRLRAGTDPERKTSRLESELSALRRELPRGANLVAWPAGQGGGERAAVVWIGDADFGGGKSLIDALRALPEVRAVWPAGETTNELRVRPHSGLAASDVSRRIDEHLAVRRLGEARAGGRRLPVLVRDTRGQSFDEIPVRRGEAILPLAAVADIELRQEAPYFSVRREGRPGLVYQIDRELDASPLAMERALERTLARFGLDEEQYRFLYNEAEPLRTLVERLLLGLAVATLLSAALGWLFGGWRHALTHALALPVALAAALNVYSVAGLQLDSTTLPMLAVALGWSLFFLVFRDSRAATIASAATIAAAALLFPVAIALAGGRLAPLFSAPAKAFLCAQLGALVALWIVPLPAGGRFHGYLRARPLRQTARVGALLRAALRNPWTVLLATLTGCYVLVVLFGDALLPEPTRNIRPATSDLRVDLRFAEGTTPAQAEVQVASAEETIVGRDEVSGQWSYYTKGFGSVFVTVEPGSRSRYRLGLLADRLQYQLAALGASATVTPLASGSGGRGGGDSVRFSDSIEDRAETDKQLRFYRFVLRATDLNALRRAHAVVMDRLVSIRFVSYNDIQSDWGRPATRVELAPRPGTTPTEHRRAAALITERSFLPRSRTLPAAGEVELRIVDPRAPQSENEVRQRRDLLGLQALEHEALVPGTILQAREVVASPAVKRQGGRYVLPMTVRFRKSMHRRSESHKETHNLLSFFPLPAGCDVELPELNPFVLSQEQQRMLWIASSLPLLLWVLAVCRLNSLRAGFLSLVPLVVGLAATAPWIRATSRNVDEATLFALAAAAAGSAPLAILVMAAARGSGSSRAAAQGKDYHWLAAHTPALAIAAAGLLALLVIPGLGLDGQRHPWAPPMRLAAVESGFAALACYLCLASLLRSAAYLRAGKARRATRRAVVEEWRQPGRLELDVRCVNKVYKTGLGGQGFHALRGATFHLEPGIIGLLGPNGAGKTTLLRILCGLLEPSRGEVSYRGHRITTELLPEYRRMVGFLPQDFNAYEGFTGFQFLDYWALEKGLLDTAQRRREVEHRLAEVGLADAAGRKVRDYSGGMRRRIGIARALIGDPPIVIVDEPTTGLDVASRNRLRESLLQVAGERIIIFSTHIASDVAAAAARILLLDRGRLLYDGAARGLVERAHGAVFEAMVDDKELREFSRQYRVTTRVRATDGVRVRAVAGAVDPPADAEIITPNLEEAYLAILDSQGNRRDDREVGASGILDIASVTDIA